jgi:hypothetical protein
MDVSQATNLAEWWKLVERYYGDHGAMVRRTASRITGNDDDAEDVTALQTVRPADFKGPNRYSCLLVSAFCAIVARNVATKLHTRGE